VNIDKLGIEEAEADDVQPAVPAVQDVVPASEPDAGDAAASESNEEATVTNS
jgi:hypothetical protein